MTFTTLTSREFHEGSSEAKLAANKGPVFITDQGQPTHVLLSIGAYLGLTKKLRNIADVLTMSGIADIEFDPPRVTIEPRPVDLQE